MQDNNNLSFENILPAINLIRENASAISDIAGDPDKAQAFLSDALGLSQAQASETVEALKQGLASYEAGKDAAEASPEAVTEGIRNSLKHYSNQERTTILSNILTAIQLGASAADNHDVAALRATNEALSEDELIEAIVASLDTLPFEAVLDVAGQTLSLESVEAISNLRSLCSANYKLAAAVLLYAEQHSGNLALDADGTPLPPEVLGAMAGASVDALIATIDLRQGRITLKKWQRVLKVILGALFVVALSVVAGVGIVSLCFGIQYVMAAIFGVGIISTVLAAVCMLGVCFKAFEWQDEAYDYAIDKMSAFYDKAIVKVTEWANRLAAAIHSFVSSSSKADAGEQAENKSNSNDTSHSNDNSSLADSDLTPQPA